MTSLSLARVLPILDSPGTSQLRLEPARPELHVVAPEYFESPEPDPEPSFEEAAPEPVEDRWQEGYEAGLALGRAQSQSEEAEREAAIAAAVEAARAEWIAQESERIASGVEKALGVIEGEICGVVERVLARVIEKGTRAQAMAQFADAVRALLREGEAGVVTVHAPQDLIEALQARLGSLPTLEFVAHDGTEIWVRSGPTMIETRLGAWRAGLTRGA
jgi:hypothetical protein